MEHVSTLFSLFPSFIGDREDGYIPLTGLKVSYNGEVPEDYEVLNCDGVDFHTSEAFSTMYQNTCAYICYSHVLNRLEVNDDDGEVVLTNTNVFDDGSPKVAEISIILYAYCLLIDRNIV